VHVDDRARQFLDRRRVAHLATADASGMPHVVPICFVLLDDCVYVAIDEKPKTADLSRLRRLRNIAVNPHVSIVADVYDDQDWSRLGFVLVRAVARIVADGAEHDRAVAALRDKYAQYESMALEERPLIAADIQAVTSWGTLTVESEARVVPKSAAENHVE
jgi:coenzyme F420-0:L-glutamate ligase/coenzyme F420-1:gamma-L-glutamate ligase